MMLHRKRRRRCVNALLWSPLLLLLTYGSRVVKGWLLPDQFRLSSSATTRQLPLSLAESKSAETANGLDLSMNGLDERQDKQLRFGGIARLYAAPDRDSARASTTGSAGDSSAWTTLERLQRATVAVIGLGGVGSWAAEALCRSGIGNLVLVDLDDICISNTNRQLHALSSTVGQLKIDEMKRRLLDINPTCNISLIHDFVSADNVHDLLKLRQENDDSDNTTDNNSPITVVLDAIDGSTEKSALLSACVDLRIPVVTVGGSAGRKDPTKIFCGELTHVSGDKLLATCRKYLRKFHGFEHGLSFQDKKKKTQRLRKWNIACVYSTEEQKSLPEGSDAPSSLRRCDGALGTACFVTGTFGFVAAARVVDMIANNELAQPRRR